MIASSYDMINIQHAGGE